MTIRWGASIVWYAHKSALIRRTGRAIASWCAKRIRRICQTGSTWLPLNLLLCVLLRIGRIPDLGGVENIENAQIICRRGSGARFAAERNNGLADSGHTMTASRRRRWAHVLKCVPPARCNTKCGEISKVGAFLCSSAKDVHDVVDHGCGVTLARCRYISYAVELHPLVDHWIVTPDIVKPLKTVRTTKSATVSGFIRKKQGVGTYRYILSLYVITE